ncbi:MAG: hypothetical protein Q9181_004052 [Wetmoreana brouardii]
MVSSKEAELRALSGWRQPQQIETVPLEKRTELPGQLGHGDWRSSKDDNRTQKRGSAGNTGMIDILREVREKFSEVVQQCQDMIGYAAL